MNSKRNFLINKVNWNILVTLGKEIKRDSIKQIWSSLKSQMVITLKLFKLYGEPSSKTKYNT